MAKKKGLGRCYLCKFYLNKYGYCLCIVEKRDGYKIVLDGKKTNIKQPVNHKSLKASYLHGIKKIKKRDKDRREKVRLSKSIKSKVSRPDRKDFYQTPEWQRLRYLTFVKQGKKCACCQIVSKKTQYHIDHIFSA